MKSLNHSLCSAVLTSRTVSDLFIITVITVIACSDVVFILLRYALPPSRSLRILVPLLCQPIDQCPCPFVNSFNNQFCCHDPCTMHQKSSLWTMHTHTQKHAFTSFCHTYSKSHFWSCSYAKYALHAQIVNTSTNRLKLPNLSNAAFKRAHWVPSNLMFWVQWLHKSMETSTRLFQQFEHFQRTGNKSK